jgi:flagellar hook-associated protein 1 FlgK
MSTFGGVLSIARSAIAAQQAAMQTISNNIANAETEGYSRERVEMTNRWPLILPIGSLGTGVDVSDITRSRDILLDTSYRNENASSQAFTMKHDLLSEIEDILNEPSSTGLAATMDAFWDAWSDLSNNPGSTSAQAVVRQRGVQISNLFQSYSTRLDDLVNRSRNRLTSAVTEVNSLTTRIAKLNGEITAAQSSGNQAPGLLDERDRLADQLAALGVSRAEIQRDGTMNLYIGGVAVVSGPTAKAIEVRNSPTLGVAIVGSAEPLHQLGGAMAAMVDFVNVDSATVRSRLDDLAKGIVNGVNEYHASGWTAAGDALGGANWNPLTPPTGSRVNFFDPSGVTAATFGLSAEVLANPAVIASGDVQGASGNNNVALAISALRDDAGMDALRTRMGAAFATQVGFAAGETYSEHYRRTATDLGVEVADADRQQKIFDVLASQADHRRTSVSGVSLDDELAKMMQYQQAYVAATRVVNAADDMMQALINMV